MKVFGSLLGAAVVAGAGLAYYVYQRHERTGQGYLDLIKQLPGEVQRVSGEARQRAADAFEQGKAAARRREADLVRQLEAARPPAAAPGPDVTSFAPATVTTPADADAPPAAV